MREPQRRGKTGCSFRIAVALLTSRVKFACSWGRNFSVVSASVLSARFVAETADQSINLHRLAGHFFQRDRRPGAGVVVVLGIPAVLDGSAVPSSAVLARKLETKRNRTTTINCTERKMGSIHSHRTNRITGNRTCSTKLEHIASVAQPGCRQ